MGRKKDRYNLKAAETNMGKLESLEEIKHIWDSNKSLEDIVLGISNIYYANGLDLPTVAAYIKATPAELDAAIRLSNFDEELIKQISDSNPPKTAWTIFASASEDEIKRMFNESKTIQWNDENSSFKLRDLLVRAAEPTIQDKVGALSGIVIEAIYKKGIAYNALNDWEKKFLKSISAQRKIGKSLSDTQINKLIDTFKNLINNNVITRDCIDNDAEYCNAVLDALGK